MCWYRTNLGKKLLTYTHTHTHTTVMGLTGPPILLVLLKFIILIKRVWGLPVTNYIMCCYRTSCYCAGPPLRLKNLQGGVGGIPPQKKHLIIIYSRGKLTYHLAVSAVLSVLIVTDRFIATIRTLSPVRCHPTLYRPYE